MTKKTVTIKLQFPVEVNGSRYDSLTFRRMKAKDLIAMHDEPNQMTAGLKLYAALADVSLSVIEELDIEDIQALDRDLEPLIGDLKKSAELAA